MASEIDQTQDSNRDDLPEGRFTGRLAFEASVLNAFQHAASEGWPELILSDVDFVDWPLNQAPVIDSLTAWASAGRKLILLANRYEEIQRHHSRFVVWRRNWGHLVDARVCDEPERGAVPSAIWSPHWCLRRTDSVHQSGFCGVDRARNVKLKELLSERLRFSSPGFSASVLGL